MFSSDSALKQIPLPKLTSFFVIEFFAAINIRVALVRVPFRVAAVVVLFFFRFFPFGGDVRELLSPAEAEAVAEAEAEAVATAATVATAADADAAEVAAVDISVSVAAAAAAAAAALAP